MLRKAAVTDVIDAEFEHVDDDIRPAAPQRRQRAADNDAASEAFGRAAPGAPPHMNLFSKRPSRTRRPAQRSAAGFAMTVAAACAVLFWLSGGYALFTGSGDPDGTGLTLSKVAVDPLRVQDKSYFVVHGVISNVSSDAQSVPLLAIGSGEMTEGQVPFYARAGKDRLAAGESTRFSVRVPTAIRNYDQLTVSLAGAGTAR